MLKIKAGDNFIDHLSIGDVLKVIDKALEEGQKMSIQNIEK